MAYSKNGIGDRIWKRQLFERYSHKGKRNFLTYSYNSTKKAYFNKDGDEKLGMDSPKIRKQISQHTSILKKKLEIKN